MMYKTSPMKRSAGILLLVLSSFSCYFVQAQNASSNTSEKSTLASRVAGLQKKDGFFPYYWDEKKGEFLFELTPAALDREFLYFASLGSGIGSLEMFADRS